MTQHDTVPWELGSDFEWPHPDVLVGQQAVPWASSSKDVLYVESGRQALGLISSHLKSHGFTNLLMPGHYCESMLDPFLRDGWNVTFVRVDSDWHCVAPDNAVAKLASTLVFSMPLFGIQESAAWLEFVKGARSSGAMVVSDETHRLFEPSPVQADFRMGSLRKMLPVPDGAFLVGIRHQLGSSGSQGSLRADAMHAKTDYLEGSSSHRHLPMYAAAEEATEHELTPAEMCSESWSLLRALDFRRMAAARARNHARLEAGLTAAGIRLTTAGTAMPSHAVIEVTDPCALRKHLINHRIYCPIHWPRPSGSGSSTGPWRDNVLSIPIDHRYDEADMDRVVDVIAGHVSEGVSVPC